MHLSMTLRISPTSGYSTDREYSSDLTNSCETDAGRGHYDIIYKNDAPLTVMLHWNTGAARSGEGHEQPGNVFSSMFPSSAFIPAPFGFYDAEEAERNIQPSDSHNHNFNYDYTHNSMDYEQSSIPQQFSSPIPMATTHSYQSSTSSDVRQEYFTLPQQTSAVPNSPPPFPSTLVLPSTSPNEPQIRLSTNMFRPGQGYVLPLDPMHVGR